MIPSFWDYLLLTFLCCLVVVFVVVAVVVVVVVATVGDPHRGTEETTVLCSGCRFSGCGGGLPLALVKCAFLATCPFHLRHAVLLGTMLALANLQLSYCWVLGYLCHLSLLVALI